VFKPLTFGSTVALFFGFAIFIIFQIPVAVSQNIYTLMVCRFLGGTFRSSPLAIVGGALADFWGPVERGFALGLFSSANEELPWLEVDRMDNHDNFCLLRNYSVPYIR